MIQVALLLATAPLLSLALPLATPPSAPVPIARVSADGVWDGGITVPAGLTITFELEIAGATGRFAAPDQQVRDVPLTVTGAPPEIRITLPGGAARFDGVLSADGMTLAGSWRRQDQVYPARFVRRTSGAAVAVVRPQTPVAPFPYAVNEVTVPSSDAVRLAATFTRPVGTAPVPAMLLIGGNGPQTRDETYAGHRPLLLLADRLTRAGTAVLRYDKRGVGGSTGDYHGATGDDLVGDARAALAWLRAQRGVDASRTCVLGLSEGAMIAPMIAARDRLACVILLSPPGVPAAALLGEQSRLAALDDGASPAAATRVGRLTRALVAGLARGDRSDVLSAKAIAAGRTPDQAAALVRDLAAPEVRVFIGTDPAVALRRLDMPVLVVVGGRDHQVAPALNLPPIRRALTSNRKAEFIVLPGANHTLQPAMTGAVREYAEIALTMEERAIAAVIAFTTNAVRQPWSAPR